MKTRLEHTTQVDKKHTRDSVRYTIVEHLCKQYNLRSSYFLLEHARQSQKATQAHGGSLEQKQA
jgi:hypothetical protein